MSKEASPNNTACEYIGDIHYSVFSHIGHSAVVDQEENLDDTGKCVETEAAVDEEKGKELDYDEIEEGDFANDDPV